jgi:hypothetical protein
MMNPIPQSFPRLESFRAPGRAPGRPPRRRLVPALLAGALAVRAALADPDVAERFGFTGPEIFPIDNLISHLRHADLDGDGREDLLVVNNARSKINLLFNQTGQTNTTDAARRPAKRELNELPPDARFRIESLASEKRIASLVVADLNSDGRPDLAYFGEPKELVVLYREGTNAWSAPKRWPLEDGLLDMNALTEGDLNGDGRTDLLLVGESAVYFLAQTADHTLAEPEKIPYSGTVKAAQMLDLNGDGRLDLLLVNWDQANPFRFRLQNANGQLGPEVHFTLPPFRSYWADDLDSDGKTEIVTIAQKSGRAQISHFVTRPAEPLAGAFRQGQFQLQPLTRTAKSRRGLVWADLNHDAATDLLVADPEGGQLTLFLQQADGTLGAARTFPAFTGIAEIAVADWDGDDRAEIFLLSTDERVVGVTRLTEAGQLPFPTPLNLEGRPLAMAAGAPRPGQPALLAVIADFDGKRELLLRAANGETRRQRLAETFKANPTGLAWHDLDQDGLADLVVLVPYEKIKVLRQLEDLRFEEQDVAPPGGSAEQPWLSRADVDGDGRPELLLAQKNFLRAVTLVAEPPPPGSTNKPAWIFRVKEQINGVSSSSRLVGAAALTNGTNAIPGLFLLDADRKVLTFCERSPAGVWQIVRNLPLPVTEFNALQPLTLAGNRPPAVGFLGLNAVAWLPLDGEVWEFKELDNYETPIREGYLHDVISGDLNHDGRLELVFLETGKNHLDIVTYEPPHRLVPANRWQVFEERTFRGRLAAPTPEPREALIADFTGDGKNDLVVLVHDRILLYPQE